MEIVRSNEKILLNHTTTRFPVRQTQIGERFTCYRLKS